MHALLLTANEQIAAEFQKFVAVTQSELIVCEKPTAELIRSSYRVFVDQALDVDKVDHPDVALIVAGSLGTTTWERAASLKANYVAEVSKSREWLMEHLVAPIDKTGKCVVVLPGCGGAGASTIASALAFHARSLVGSVVLVDCDSTSAGLDIVAGAEQIAGMRWKDFSALAGVVNATDIVRGLPSIHDVSILSMGSEPLEMPANEMVAMIEQLLTVSELVILDLSRHEGLVRESKLIAMADAVLVVVPATVRGCASADRVIANASDNNELVELVVRTIPGAGLTPIEIANILNTPLAGTVTTDSRILEQIEQGFGVGAIHLGGFTRNMNAIATRLLPVSENAFAA